MKQQERKITVGVDVSKNRLDVFELETHEGYSIPNELECIHRWLERWDAPMRLAIEPTNRYHEAVAQAAHARGHQVYLIDPHRLTHYRQGVGATGESRPPGRAIIGALSRARGQRAAPVAARNAGPATILAVAQAPSHPGSRKGSTPSQPG